MMKQNAELRAEARAALGGKWVMAAVATLVFTAVAGAASYIPLVGFILVALPLGYGYAMTLLDVVRGGNDVNIATLLAGFNDFGRIEGTKGNLHLSMVVVACNTGHCQNVLICHD